MSEHITRNGMDVDEMGFISVTCSCGEVVGPMPDPETALDVMMEHAYYAGVSDGRAAAGRLQS